MSLLASTTPLAEAGTAIHLPLSGNRGRSGMLTSTVQVATIQSRRDHQLWRFERSALRLRLTGSVVQPMSCYGLMI